MSEAKFSTSTLPVITTFAVCVVIRRGLGEGTSPGKERKIRTPGKEASLFGILTLYPQPKRPGGQPVLMEGLETSRVVLTLKLIDTENDAFTGAGHLWALAPICLLAPGLPHGLGLYILAPLSLVPSSWEKVSSFVGKE